MADGTNNSAIHTRAKARYSAEPHDLEHLTGDNRYWVRASVANNPHAPVQLLAALGHDRDPAVRTCVAGNPKTPAALRAVLEVDPHPGVRWAAISQLEGRDLDAHAADPQIQVRVRVATLSDNPTVLSVVLEPFDREVAIAALANPALGADNLYMLAGAKFVGCHGEVLAHPLCDRRVLARLAGSPDRGVRESVYLRCVELGEAQKGLDRVTLGKGF